MNKDKSEATVLKELSIAETFKVFVYLSSDKIEFSPSIIAGIISRESDWGLTLKPPGPSGTGDFGPRNKLKPFRTGLLPSDGGGFGRGLMQIDYDAHEFARGKDWPDAKLNIGYGCQVLRASFRIMRMKLGLNHKSILSGAIAGYNCGPMIAVRSIQSGLGADGYTTGKDYSEDVLFRSEVFKSNGWV